jgi:hypothetical protein
VKHLNAHSLGQCLEPDLFHFLGFAPL